MKELYHLKKALIRLTALTAISLSLVSCATHHVSLLSNPTKARIYSRGTNESKGKLIGETPISLSALDLNKDSSTSGPIVIEFEKDGYDTKSILLTEAAVAGMIISADLSLSNSLADSQQLNWSVESLFEAQRLIRVGRHEEALRVLNTVEKVAPQLAVLHELKGTLYYLKNQYQEARDAYAQVLRINPKNLDAISMMHILKGLTREPDELNRLPASESAKQK